MDTPGRPTLDADRLLEVLDGVPVLLWMVDLEGRVVYLNRGGAELVGIAPEELIGRTPDGLFDPVVVARWSAENEEVLRTGRPRDVEDRVDDHVFLTHKAPLFGADGKPVGVIGLSTDITQPTRARERLAEAQQIAGVGSWHWNTATGTVEWSPGGAEPRGSVTKREKPARGRSPRARAG